MRNTDEEQHLFVTYGTVTMLTVLYLLGLYHLCVAHAITVEDLAAEAMCQAKCLQNGVECDHDMEDCIVNLTSTLIESDFPVSSLLPEEEHKQINLVCHDEEFLVVEWPPSPLIVYVVELQNSSIANWTPVNNTISGKVQISGLEANNDYRVRIRAFASDGQVGTATVSEILSTASDISFLQPVSNLTITEMTLLYKSVDAVVEWAPSPDLPCNYEVLMWIPGHHYDQIINEDLYKATLHHLEFKTRYTIEVRAVAKLFDGRAMKESVKTSIDILIPACLDYYPGNLTICSPQEPSNVIASEKVNEKNDSLCDINVVWSKPNAMPEYYTVILETHNRRMEQELNKSTNLPGNHTQAEFRELQSIGDEYFEVTVVAVSAGGQTQVKRYKENKHCLVQSFYGHKEDNLSILWTLLVVFSAITLFLGVTMFYYRRNKRKKNKKKIHFQEDFKAPSIYNSHLHDKMCEKADEYEIKKDHIVICDLLGEGAFGIVHRGLLNKATGDPQEVAIKMLQENPTIEEFRQFQKEIEVMKSVGKHKNIVSLIGCCTQGKQLLLVIEYCALGDLQNYLRQEWKTTLSKCKNREIQKNNDDIKYADLMSHNSKGSYRQDLEIEKPNCVFNELYGIQNGKHKRLTPADLLGFARQVAIGMEHLSNNRVIHRDLAARNVLVCSNLTLKISDFGLSRDVYEQSIYHKKESEKLPIKWMALESLTHQVYTTQSDIWSFGILLWEIATLGGNPYPSTPTSQMFRLLKLGYRMECPPSCSTSLYNIMLSCWKANPKSRPTFSTLVEKLDKLLENYSPNEYLNLELLYDQQQYGEIWESDNSSEDL